MKRPQLILVFCVALAVRLLHVWQLRRSPFFDVLLGDSRGYDEWAQRIAAGDWIGRDVFYQAPLYPYALGAIYAAVGRHLLVVRVVQAVLGAASCVFVALAASRVVSRRAGVVAGLMLALYAPAIFFDALIQKSVLDVFFLSLAMWMLAQTIDADRADNAEHAQKRPRRAQHVLRDTSWRAWLAVGLAIGALALTRENALVFAAVIAVWAFVRGRARALALFAAGVAIVVMPVAIRNSVLGGGFYVTTSQFGPNFYIGNNPRADGSYQSLRFGRGAPEYERQDATELAEHATGRRLTPAEVSSYWTERALDFIAGQPLAWLKLMGRKAALLTNATEMVDTESQESHAEWSLPLRLAGTVGHFGVLVPLAVFGLVVSWRDRARIAVFAAMLLAYAASVVMFYVFARYRYPLVPLLVLFAAAGLDVLVAAACARGELFARLRPSLTMAAVVAVAFAVFANWPIASAAMNRAVTEHNLGAALQADGRYDDAIAHYRRALDIDPGYVPAYNNIGTALRAKGQLPDAVAAYQRALQLRPDYPEAQYNLANALLDAGKSDEAAAHFGRAIASMGDSADVHNNLGIALAQKGRTNDAIAEFRRAVQLDPDSARAHRNLGDALATAGERDDALQHLRRAVQLDPADAAARYDLASTLLEAGMFDEAIVEFRATLRLTPDAADAHNNLGIALASKGQIDEATREFETALKLKPDFADARQNLQRARGIRRD